MSFALHPRLEKGTHVIGKSGSCRVLLKDNADFPWILIVPEVSGDLEELHQLPPEQFAEVVFMIRRVSQFMSDRFQPGKLNVACLGNIVRQMHIHVVARSEDDPAWPGPVWGHQGGRKYEADEIIEICVEARLALDLGEVE
jgi:diadenosine tetraphosphate (Ap4A) HIT family hydrolase